MGVTVALFTDIHTYKIEEADNISKMVEMACEYTAGKGYKRGYTKTDPWMNRYCIFENGETRYVIIPSNIPCVWNNFLSTVGKFAIFLIKGEEIVSITSEDIDFLIENYPTIFSKERVEKQEEEFQRDLRNAQISSDFAFLLIMLCNEEKLYRLKNEGIKALKEISLILYPVAEKWIRKYLHYPLKKLSY